MPFSLLDPQLHDKLILCQKAYSAAETALKENEIESINDGLCFPAVNELRYAGNHLARVLSAHELPQALINADKALCHAQRAIYDAYDALIMFYFKQCQNFKEDYQSTYISSTIPQYVEHLYVLEKLQSEIAVENRESKELYADNKQKQLDTIRAIYKQWNCSRDELNKINIKERHADRNVVVGFILTGIGIIVAIILAIVFS